MTFSSIEVLQLLECNDSEKKIQKLDRKYIYLIKLNIDIGSIKFFFFYRLLDYDVSPPKNFFINR